MSKQVDIFFETAIIVSVIDTKTKKEENKMDTKFSVAIHTLVMFSESEKTLRSEDIAKSVNTNASYIRKVISLLKRANLLLRNQGSFEYFLIKPKEEISLLDIYVAVQPQQLLHTHQQSNPDCPVGSHINHVLDPIVAQAEQALQEHLAQQTLADIIGQIRKEIENESQN